MFQVYNIARVYAKAAFSFAKNHNVQKEWGMCLKKLQEINTLRETQILLHNPNILLETKVDWLMKFFGCDFHSMRIFLHILIAKNRMFLLKKINIFYDEYLLHDQGIQIVYVTTAYMLDEKMLNALKIKLQLHISKEIVFKVEVKPELVAGIILRINDKIIDNSINRKINNLNSSIQEVVSI